MGLREVAAFDTADGLYDCAWCEVRVSPARLQRRLSSPQRLKPEW
jgi:hypothetical protein